MKYRRGKNVGILDFFEDHSFEDIEHNKCNPQQNAGAHLLNGPTQLLDATGIEGGIHDCQVLKYQP